MQFKYGAFECSESELYSFLKAFILMVDFKMINDDKLHNKQNYTLIKTLCEILGLNHEETYEMMLEHYIVGNDEEEKLCGSAERAVNEVMELKELNDISGELLTKYHNSNKYSKFNLLRIFYDLFFKMEYTQTQKIDYKMISEFVKENVEKGEKIKIYVPKIKNYINVFFKLIDELEDYELYFGFDKDPRCLEEKFVRALFLDRVIDDEDLYEMERKAGFINFGMEEEVYEELSSNQKKELKKTLDNVMDCYIDILDEKNIFDYKFKGKEKKYLFYSVEEKIAPLIFAENFKLLSICENLNDFKQNKVLIFGAGENKKEDIIEYKGFDGQKFIDDVLEIKYANFLNKNSSLEKEVYLDKHYYYEKDSEIQKLEQEMKKSFEEFDLIVNEMDKIFID